MQNMLLVRENVGHLLGNFKVTLEYVSIACGC